MELTEKHDWDERRLEDVPRRIGTQVTLKIINRLSTKLCRCPCTEKLAPYLLQRKVVLAGNYQNLTSPRVTDETKGRWLVEAVKRVSSEPLAGSELCENLYLALMDKYESDVDEWCREFAVTELRNAIFEETVTPRKDYLGKEVALLRLPHAPLSEDIVSRLQSNLGLTHHHQHRNLRQIVQQWLSEKQSPPLSELVSALILTPTVGKYVCNLLPHFLCNPAEVYKFMRCLKTQWKGFASFLGYSKEEVTAVEAQGGKDPYDQIRFFLRVWWMPESGGKKEMMDTLQHIMLTLMNPKVPTEAARQQVHVAVAEQSDGTELLQACKQCDWIKAESLIKSGCYLEACSQEQRTPLMYACLKRQERIVELLVSKGANLQHMDNEGKYCLHFPETLRNHKILACLLQAFKERHLSLDLVSKRCMYTPLAKAIMIGASNSAELLLAHNANPNCSKKASSQPLIEACVHGHMRLVKELVKHGADLDIIDQRDVTALLQACISKHWAVAQFLIEEGANINLCRPDGTSPLFLAIESNMYIVASELIAKGADMNIIRFPGDGRIEETPLAFAASRGMRDIVELLLRSGVNINALIRGTMPAIGYAIIKDKTEIFRLLLAHLDLDRSIFGLATPIITAIKMEKHYFTEELLKELGGFELALQKAQQTQMTPLLQHLMTYKHLMESTSGGHSEWKALPTSLPLPPSPSMPHSHEFEGTDKEIKVEEVLHHFCQICSSAVVSETLSHDTLVEFATITNPSLGAFFRRVFNHNEPPEYFKQDFLSGTPSPLQFLIENKILTCDMFQLEVLKFHSEGTEDFYRELIWTFHQMEGGADLPFGVESVLTQMFNGEFIPNVSRRNQEEPPYFSHHQEPQIGSKRMCTAVSTNIIQASNNEANIRAESVSSAKHLAKLNGILCFVPTLSFKQVPVHLPPPHIVVQQIGEEPLGYGSYGEVVEVEYRGTRYAAKKYHYRKTMLKQFGRELEILTAVKHPNVVLYIGLYNLGTRNGPTVLVMEKMEVNLSEYLKKHQNMPLQRKFAILHDVACGLAHLHSQKPAIIHRDLTATNVLLDLKGIAKIADFGNSRMVDVNSTPEMTSNPGTLDYMPPEALERKYGVKMDVFSYGHLSIHVFIQHQPHPILKPVEITPQGNLPRTEVERRIKYMNEATKILKKGHPFLGIITQCLHDLPDKRPHIIDFVDTIKNM